MTEQSGVAVSNYRPISLLSAVGKVLEKVVHKHLFNYVRDHDILSAMQIGIYFR